MSYRQDPKQLLGYFSRLKNSRRIVPRCLWLRMSVWVGSTTWTKVQDVFMQHETFVFIMMFQSRWNKVSSHLQHKNHSLGHVNHEKNGIGNIDGSHDDDHLHNCFCLCSHKHLACHQGVRKLNNHKSSFCQNHVHHLMGLGHEVNS